MKHHTPLAGKHLHGQCLERRPQTVKTANYNDVYESISQLTLQITIKYMFKTRRELKMTAINPALFLYGT